MKVETRVVTSKQTIIVVVSCYRPVPADLTEAEITEYLKTDKWDYPTENAGEESLEVR